MDEVVFGPGSVPVAVAARVYGKDACWVRAGIITGYLSIGTATRNGKVITSIDQMVFAIDDKLRFPNPRDTDAEDEDGI